MRRNVRSPYNDICGTMVSPVYLDVPVGVHLPQHPTLDGYEERCWEYGPNAPVSPEPQNRRFPAARLPPQPHPPLGELPAAPEFELEPIAPPYYMPIAQPIPRSPAAALPPLLFAVLPRAVSPADFDFQVALQTGAGARP